MLNRKSLLLVVPFAAVVFAAATFFTGAADEPKTIEFELQKFDNAGDYIVKPGPGGTDWDSQYRALIQTSENAVSKGYPSHSEALEQIREDALASPQALQMHKNYIVFIKHFSQSYRPEEATIALKKLYYELVAAEFGADPEVLLAKLDQQQEPKPAADQQEKALPFQGDPRLNIYRDVPYGKDGHELQKLDAYILKSEKPTPVLIEIHGGGWRRGVKSAFDGTYKGGLINKILDAGISVVSIDYRLTPDHEFPAQEQDAARAVQFIRSKAKDWNIDPTRIAAMGGSAGAHLSAWVALHDDLAKPESDDPVERRSTRLTAFVDFSGPMDLTRVRPTQMPGKSSRGEDFANAFTQAFGATYESYENDPEIRKRVRAASPLFYVTPDDPPAFVRHMASAEWAGKDHPPVPEMVNDPHSAMHGVLLADAMEKAGIEVVRDIGPHVGKDPDKGAAAVVAFLKKHLKVQ